MSEIQNFNFFTSFAHGNMFSQSILNKKNVFSNTAKMKKNSILVTATKKQPL